MFNNVEKMQPKPTKDRMREMEEALRERLNAYAERGFMFTVETAINNYQVTVKTPRHSVQTIIRDDMEDGKQTLREKMWQKELDEKLEDQRRRKGMGGLNKAALAALLSELTDK